MTELTIELGARSYQILVGPGMLSDPLSFRDVLGTRSLVVTSAPVAALYLAQLRASLGDQPHDTVVLPDGEAAKSLVHLERIVDAAAAAGIGRDGTLIALGGGSIGDVAGFAAGMYHRGIGYIQVPTTLLAQVDSAVGGKTAVNLRAGKNLIGVFHQPRRVIADISTLGTLPGRELRSGLAEVAKYALIDGDEMVDWLAARMADLLAGDSASLSAAVVKCCRIKARIVAADETDRGPRALLNFGHTFGHALETLYEGRLLHGEAVALGCVLAVRMSQSLGWIGQGAAARAVALFAAAGLPTTLPAPVPEAEAILAQMGRDKKAADGRIHLVLLKGIGAAELTTEYPRAALVLTLRDFTSQAR